jgi:hypothetical protein
MGEFIEFKDITPFFETVDIMESKFQEFEFSEISEPFETISFFD